ncbi:MAG: glucose 1-dehydrogenase [Pseudomonadota bacterium]
MGRVQDKVALITGAASGLGQAMAERLAEEGAKIVVADIDVENGQKVAADIGENAVFISLDVTSESQWQDIMRQTEAHFGQLDVLVNNAGITLMGSIEDISFADWRKTMDIDLDGVFLGCKYGIELMKKSGGGSIINISSASGLKASSSLAAYNAAKSAVTLLTKSIALHCGEQRYGIRCNSVHPGTIKTPILEKVLAQVPNPDETMARFVSQHPIGHIGEPKDIANVVLYLASDEAKFATGGQFSVDGGLTL